jgi:hypothetical protein
MTEKAQDGSSAGREYLDLIFRVIRENEDFLRENSEELYGEIVGLMNDAIDHIRIAIEKGTGVEDYVKCSVLYFLNHLLMPICGAIYVNTLTGNLPACFMELRLALESLVKCCLADLKYPGPEFFRDRLHLLEKELREDNTSISSLMKELDKYLGLNGDSYTIWRELSERWVHARGIMDGIVDHVIEKSDVPPWGLVIPMRYSRDDLSDLDELQKRLAQFSRILGVAMKERKQRVSSSCA